MTRPELTPPDDIDRTVLTALSEDIGDGDRNAELVDGEPHAQARIIARESAILSGTPWVDAIFSALDPAVTIGWHYQDGQRVATDCVVCEIDGPVRALLSGERTALNFLQLLSGVASATAEYVNRIEGTRAHIVDTRKTLPGLRSAQKYAVRCGGGRNHRFGLFDAFLVKENHILAAGGIQPAIDRARQQAPKLFLQVEVESLEELDAALAGSADGVLLDNFDTATLVRATAHIDAHHARTSHKALSEASGDIDLDNVAKIARTGVDRISIGGLTKHVRATNFSMRLLDTIDSEIQAG